MSVADSRGGSRVAPKYPESKRGRLVLTLIGGAYLLITAGCGGGGGDGGGPVTPPPPPPPSVASITVSQDTATLVPTVTVQLTATARDASGNALSRTISWTTSDASKATVTSSGLVTGVALGTATITAAADGRSAQARMSVKDGAVVGATATTLTGLGGNVSLDIPAGTFASNTMVTIDNATAAPVDPRLVGGTAIELGAPATPTQPLTLRLKYRTEAIPAGPPERLLRLHRVQGTAWQTFTSTVDAPNRTLTGTITAVGMYGILTPAFVASVSLSQTALQLRAGATATLTATPRDAAGAALVDRDVAWTSSNPAVATVGTNSGVVTAVTSGSATITANVEGKTAAAAVTVVEPVASVTFDAPTYSVQIWGTQQASVTLRDRNNNILTGRVITWNSSNTGVATVDNAGLLSGFSPGGLTLTATSEGVSATAAVTVPTLPPLQLTSISPATLTRGSTATITGQNFGRRLIDNQVSIAGVSVSVTIVTQTQLTVNLPNFGFPCVAAGSRTVSVARAGSPVATLQHPVAASTIRSMQLGESIMLGSTADLVCNEIDFAANQHYLYTVINSTTSPTAVASFELRSSTTGATSTNIVSAAAVRSAPELEADAPRAAGTQNVAMRAETSTLRDHDRILRLNADIVRRFGSPATALRNQPLRNVAARATAPVNRTIGAMNALRFPDLSASDPCNTFIAVNARTVAAGQRAIVLEDVTAPFAGSFDSYYQQIAQQFDATMWPILTSYFGNPLAMDAQLDADGSIVMLFTPQINNLFAGLNGFVITCDFFPEATAKSSNRGEVFYARVPTAVSGNTTAAGPGWFHHIRSTVIHEVKHLVMYAERFSRAGSGSPNLEEYWLEEGTARMSEEFWGRVSSGAQFKGNTRYNPGLYCDYRWTFPQCAGKAAAMTEHFAGLYEFLFQRGNRSPLGRINSSDFTFYSSAWSFVRWMLDHNATTEQAFLSALVQDASKTGIANLEARSGKTFVDMLARWAVANWADDRSGVTILDPTAMHLSWETRNVFANLFLDFPSVFQFPSPINTHQPTQGTWQISDGVRGGSYVIVRIQGSQVARQMLELRGSSSSTIPASLRVYLVRVQ